ncbi:hypothetical protein MGA3_11430 [Bacillus methanolicus MGA3]|uniref:Uncharacterized protein n=1 Tax=Bacillus methanolicus (strain MGA3 / ATCC 53907) TaxID=796606 RepID=I3E332_BACMM|nr:hypothetical protein BMMGA3_02680 [Bacillus methanolicus MGA3]EIJ80903.1 hypothetical protein MGA3_11430 [Bacillus methanolicus MGA3]
MNPYGYYLPQQTDYFPQNHYNLYLPQEQQDPYRQPLKSRHLKEE